MEIKKIQNIVMSSLLVAGLAGCSNSSSISQTDSSPWKSKRSAEAAASTEFVEVSLDEAVQVNDMEQAPVIEETMVEPEMVAQPELESLSDFNPEPVPVESMSAFERLESKNVQVEPEMAVVEGMPGIVGSDIMSASPSAYAVQVYAGRKLANVNRYISSHGLDNMQIVKTDRDGDVIYVLVGLYADRASAKQAVDELEQSTGSRPWIRSVGSLQSIAAQ
ncbi:MAG: SPOR domain-containing protein [Gammaproteobacteria bacterium]|nr:SPOR domain-containing protein [Gammaproteobacteria bacterium]